MLWSPEGIAGNGGLDKFRLRASARGRPLVAQDAHMNYRAPL
jgi:hypothetical protein